MKRRGVGMGLPSLCVLSCCFAIAAGQLITQPPVNTTTALGTNATFSCHGLDGSIEWEINGVQILVQSQVDAFSSVEVYVPLPTSQGVSELVITGTQANNATLSIRCIVFRGIFQSRISDESYLLVYAEPRPPSNLAINVNGLNLVVMWTEPFSLQGEEIYYVVSITNMATRENREFNVNTTSYVLSEPFGDQRNCEEYEFSVFSRNGYSRSNTSVTGMKPIPTTPLVLRSSDVDIDVSLSSGVRADVTVNSPDPCSTYPVSSYIFNITERNTTSASTSVQLDSSSPLILDNANAGLLPDRVYSLYIDAVNSVGSTPSEEILLYTTGLQSSSAIILPDGRVVFTCIFAPGATSTGCQFTLITGLGNMVVSNVTRHGDMEALHFMLFFTPITSFANGLVVQTAELLSGGGVSDVLFVVLNFPRPVMATTTVTAPSSSVALSLSTPSFTMATTVTTMLPSSAVSSLSTASITLPMTTAPAVTFSGTPTTAPATGTQSTMITAPIVTSSGTQSTTMTTAPAVTSSGTQSITMITAPIVTSSGTQSTMITAPIVTSSGTPRQSTTMTTGPAVTSSGTQSTTMTTAPAVTSSGTHLQSTTMTTGPAVTSSGTQSTTMSLATGISSSVVSSVSAVSISLKATTTPTPVMPTPSSPSPNATIWIAVAVGVTGAIVLLALIVILIICGCRIRSGKIGLSKDEEETKVYDDAIVIETTPNEVYGLRTDVVQTTPNEVYEQVTDYIQTTPNEVFMNNTSTNDSGNPEFETSVL